MLAVAKSGHLDSSLSAADIVAALYYRVLRHDPERPDWPERDRFVLCKGHAAPIQYAALAHHGYFQLRDLMGAAPDRLPAPGPSGHEPHDGRRGLDRVAGPGPLDVPRDLPRAASRRARLDGAGLRAALRRRLPGGPDVGGRDGRGPLRGPEPDRDRRLQPPPDRRHDRGGHGHRRRARQVRGLRLGRGRDRRPRHERDRRGARAQPNARRPGGDRLPDAQGPRRLDDGGPLRLPRQAADPGAGRGGADRARGAARRADEGACRRPAATRSRTDGGGRDGADRDPARLRRRARRAGRGATRTSSRSTPTSRSRRSRRSSARPTPSASSTSARPRPT